MTGLYGRSTKRRVKCLTFTAFYFLSNKVFMDFWSKKFIIKWDFNASGRCPFSFWCNTMVFRNYCFRRINFPDFHSRKKIFWLKRLEYDQLKSTLYQIFCFCFLLTFFFLCQYHDSMTAIILFWPSSFHSNSSPIVYL